MNRLLSSIFGTISDKYVSPVEILQSCMSLQRLGVSHIRFEAVEGEDSSDSNEPSRLVLSVELAGTILSHLSVLFEMSPKYTNGSCLAAYNPLSPRKHPPGEH